MCGLIYFKGYRLCNADKGVDIICLDVYLLLINMILKITQALFWQNVLFFFLLFQVGLKLITTLKELIRRMKVNTLCNAISIILYLFIYLNYVAFYRHYWFIYHICPVGWGCKIHRLHLCRGLRPLHPASSVLDMAINYVMVKFQ